MTLGAFMREGRCRICESCHSLLDQMRYFTGRDSDKDDLIDAASMIFSTVESFSQYYWYQPQGMEKKFGFTFRELFKPAEPTWEGQYVS